MGTLETMIDSFPYPIKRRYMGSDGLGTQWVTWLNDGLIELEKEDLLPENTYKAGVEVENDVWITPPAAMRRAIELSHANEPSIKPSIAEVQGKLEIVNGMTFTKESDPETIATFSAQATDSITVDVDEQDEDTLKNYLLVIDTGLLATNTYVISGNDASVGSTTKIYFLHELSTAWTAPQAVTGHLVNPRYYLNLKYAGFYEPITVIGDEIPVSKKFESSLKAWLMWKAYERVRTISNDTKYWEEQWTKQVQSIRNDRLRINRLRNTRGRRLHGMEQRLRNRYAHTHTSE